MLKKGIKVRYADKPFNAAGKQFEPGSLLITRAGNNREDFDRVVVQTAVEFNEELTPLSSGFVEKGYDLGSDVIRYIRPPHIMLIAGEAVNNSTMGEAWQFFEQQLNYPVTVVKYQDLHRVKLSDFDVAIFPDGEYEDFPSDRLQSWVRDGGKLIAMQNTVALLVDKKGFDIKKKEKKKDDKPEVKKKPVLKLYGDRDRDALATSVPGAIFKVNLDNTHPLGFGYPGYYYSLKAKR